MIKKKIMIHKNNIKNKENIITEILNASDKLLKADETNTEEMYKIYETKDDIITIDLEFSTIGG